MNTTAKVEYVCYKCGAVFSKPYTYCPFCGGLLLARYKITPQPKKNLSGLMKYIDFLPIGNIQITLGEGGTPLIRLDKLANELGGIDIYVKDESRNPTGSFVDRGVTVFINYFRDTRNFVCATTGDTGVSLAAYSAKIDANVDIYAPASVSKQKIFQMALFGANVHIVENYGKAKYLSTLHSEDATVFSEESPLYIEGVKTIALEIYEELGEIDSLIAPFGSGALIFAIWKGFKELLDLGYIDTMPRIFGVKIASHTANIATDLFLSIPNLRAVVEKNIVDTGGRILNVDPNMIRKYILFLIRKEGFFIDPAGVVSIAGLVQLGNKIKKFDRVVAILTGSGLKTIDEIESLVTVRDIRNIQVESKLMLGSRIGKTKIEILRLLREYPMHGYQLRQRLRERGINLAFSTLYQHLRELTGAGLIVRIPKRSKGRKIIVYKLSENGERILRDLL